MNKTARKIEGLGTSSECETVLAERNISGMAMGKGGQNGTEVEITTNQWTITGKWQENCYLHIMKHSYKECYSSKEEY